jgi:hypothetical protein
MPMIADLIKALLQNLFVVFIVIAVLASIGRIRRARLSRRPFSGSYILWGEMLFYVYGLANIYGGAMHAYYGDAVAATIGWQNSPFQYELGWFEIAYGFTALFSGRQGYAYRVAMTIPYSLFALAAAAQHIDMMAKQKNYAPNNAGLVLWLGDIIVPLVMLALTWFARDAED